MKKTLSQAGFAAHVALLVLVLVAVVGLAGYKVMNMNKTTSSTAPTTSAVVTEPKTIKTKADLTATGKVLDQSATELNTSLDDTTLDSDLNIML